MDDLTFTPIINKFLNCRSKTLELIENLYEEDTVVQSERFVSPIKWHLGHTSWFFENFILAQYDKNYKIFNDGFSYIFNSYYNVFGSFNKQEKRGLLNRPLLSEIIEYREFIDLKITKLLEKKSFNEDINFLITLGINHEQQHQELILMDLKHIFYSNPLKPYYIKKIEKNFLANLKYKNHWNLDQGINFKVGGDPNKFCFDNELPEFDAFLTPFNLSEYVTNNDWLRFIDDGGYEKYEYWLSDGWELVNKYKIKRPLYWIDNNHHFDLSGVNKINKDLPVSHISYYEANAFANYLNKRLPSEYEVEFVLKNTQENGIFLEDQMFKEVSYNNKSLSSSFFGNLWVWTSSNYNPYKGYESLKLKANEYNSKFMCNQFVLKGGSFATPRDHIRPSYRNFYYPSDRWQFSGLRLVEDLN